MIEGALGIMDAWMHDEVVDEYGYREGTASGVSTGGLVGVHGVHALHRHPPYT
jgi:hypothetical protein